MGRSGCSRTGKRSTTLCVEMTEDDDPGTMQLETGSIPGGRYARRRIVGWEKVVREGRLPAAFDEFAESLGPYVDHDGIRPCLEFYRSHEELLILVPIKSEAAHGESKIIEEPQHRSPPA